MKSANCHIERYRWFQSRLKLPIPMQTASFILQSRKPSIFSKCFAHVVFPHRACMSSNSSVSFSTVKPDTTPLGFASCSNFDSSLIDFPAPATTVHPSSACTSFLFTRHRFPFGPFISYFVPFFYFQSPLLGNASDIGCGSVYGAHCVAPTGWSTSILRCHRSR